MDPPPTTAFLDISLCMEGLSPITAKKVVQSISTKVLVKERRRTRTRLLLVQARTRDSLTHQKAIATSTNLLLLEHTLFAGLPFSCITLLLLPTRHLVPSAKLSSVLQYASVDIETTEMALILNFFCFHHASNTTTVICELRGARCEVRSCF